MSSQQPRATSARPATAIDAIAESYVDSFVTLSPMEATYYGIAGHDADLDDLSPDGLAEHSALRRSTLAALAEATPTDDVDRLTIAAMTDRLTLAEQMYAAGLDHMNLNVLACPAQSVRDIFDLMGQSTEDDWATFATRMAKVPEALAGYQASLLHAREQGDVAARRQVAAVIGQCEDNVASDGYFTTLVEQARVGDGPLPTALARDLAAARDAAATAYRELGEFLRTELLPHAPESDAFGRERYPLVSQVFVGAKIDLEETYAWGQEQVAEISTAMDAVAGQIRPGASVKEAIALLDADPRYRLEGTDALQRWMQTQADAAIAELADVHFDIPAPARTIECRIAPTQTGGIYYTGPSEDFTRPGRMWWSVPKGDTEFGTWRELTTVYHEGVPGHHLQIAQTVLRAETLNRWRRLMAWTSGYGEGWALYAERLMAELGFMDDPGNRLGWLDMQSLRAARVVIDIGVHCDLPAPAEVGGGAWTYDKAWAYLTAHANQSEKSLRFELDRYLGWPGQAPSYKIGERLWLSLREEMRQREGADFDLKAFHRRALDIGGVDLETLRAAVLGQLS
ncbi:MAG TPA: DUF885 domain-containing protein [Dermatophilaceae bacterium]|nr:DUF885 domain-containing protein [Dermatophilaceae bacterium]HMT88935.1 DUF885 domain-containing protein [Dermatophilaceae bacterium]